MQDITTPGTADSTPEESAAPQETPEPQTDTIDASDTHAALEAELSSTKDQLLRAVAEQENLRKRAERDKVDMAKYAIAEFAKELVSVADNFERAFASIPGDQTEAHPLIKSLLEGLKMTEEELLRVLKKHGIQKCDPAIGDKFDPNFHQAVCEIDHEAEKGHIAQVMQIGYTHHERLLRPAMVGVSKGPNKS